MHPEIPLAGREQVKQIGNPLRLYLMLARWRRDKQAPIILEPKTQSIGIDTVVHRGIVSQ
jgi:hypothetical protein